MATPEKLPIQRRAASVEFDALATRTEGDERIPIALSSEMPVERFFGTEILDHEAKSIDLGYAREGLPFLVNHDTDRQVGIIEDVVLGDDRKLRGVVRFSRSAEAQQIRQDILDGIRKNISVGYRIDEFKLEKSDKSKNETYRATRWTPMEGSSVPVPADISVGVGRAADEAAFPVVIQSSEPAPVPKESRMSEQTAATGAAPTTTTGSATRAEVEVAVRGHATEIIRMCRENKMADKAEGFIERGLSPEAVAVEILRAQRATPAEPVAVPAVDVRVHAPEKFKTLGEQLGAIVRAGMPGGGLDQRLVGRAASGSSGG
jgi:hypothetical protein